jgi:tetratricopeptide (TPR) repeat protein
VATTCNNLGLLLSDTNRMEEAEARYGEALETYRRLADANPAAYLPDVAMTCYNVGLFERDRGNADAARKYFQEALSLYEKFPHCAQRAQMCRDALAFLDKAQ